MHAQQAKFVAVFAIAVVFATSVGAIEVTEPAGAAHGYPGLCDMNGKKLANGEFRQWVEDDQLRIVISYKFPDGQLFEENSRFRQEPELIQEQWSWKESKGAQPTREFAVDFLSGTATARIRTEDKNISEKIDIERGRTFAGFGFTLALANLRKRLVGGEKIELKAVGFTPKPRVVTVKIWHGGVEQLKMAGRTIRGDNFVIRPEIPAIAKLFVRVSDTHIWLTHPAPGGFLRWEGSVALTSDPFIRVDLLSGSESGPAKPVEAKR